MMRWIFAFALLALFALSYAGYCMGANGELDAVFPILCSSLSDDQCEVAGNYGDDGRAGPGSCILELQVVDVVPGSCRGVNQQCAWQDNEFACRALNCNWMPPQNIEDYVCTERERGYGPWSCALLVDEASCTQEQECEWVGGCSEIWEQPTEEEPCCQGLVIDEWGLCACNTQPPEPSNACRDIRAYSHPYCSSVMSCSGPSNDHVCYGGDNGMPLGNACENAQYYAACIGAGCCIQMGESCAGDLQTGCCPGSTCAEVEDEFVCVQPNIVLQQGEPFAQPSEAHSGEQVSIDVVVRNEGNGATGGQFVVRAQASGGGEVLQAEDVSVQALGAEQEAHAVFEFTCPNVVQDAHYALSVQADAGNAIVESSEGDNSLSAVDVFVCKPLVPLPNLVLQNARATPSLAESGRQIEIRVRVLNNGQVPTPAHAEIPVNVEIAGIWEGEQNARPFGQESLDVDQSQDLQFSFTCPEVQALTNYAVVIAVDAQGEIEEMYENDNVVRVNVACEPPHIPNLVPVAGNPEVEPAEARSREQVTINVVVENRGNLATPDGQQVAVRVSANGIGEQVVYVQPIDALSSSRQIGVQLTCPHVDRPTQYSATITVDADRRVQESNENDNIIQSANFNCLPWGQPSLALILMAFMLALAIIVLAFFVGYAFDLPHIRASASDELLHLVATGIVLIGVSAFAIAMDTEYLPKLAGAAAGANTQLSLSTQAGTILNNIYNSQSAIFSNLQQLNNNLGVTGSKSVYCTFLGAGYTLVSCSTLNMMRGSIVQGLVVSTAAIADISAEKLLFKFTQLYAFTVLLPIGLFLHAFKLTRSAGAALISIAVGFYVVYPLMVVFTENMLIGQVVGQGKYFGTAPVSVPTGVSCDPMEQNWGQINAVQANISNPAALEYLLFQGLVRSIFATVLKLMVTLAFIRAFASLLGSEIDVSSLARIS